MFDRKFFEKQFIFKYIPIYSGKSPFILLLKIIHKTKFEIIYIKADRLRILLKTNATIF